MPREFVTFKCTECGEETYYGSRNKKKHPEKMEIKNINSEVKKRAYVQKLELNLEQLEKGGFEHYMLKEIFEQPKAISDSMRGRVNTKKDVVSLGGIIEYEEKMLNAKRFIIACLWKWNMPPSSDIVTRSLTKIMW